MVNGIPNSRDAFLFAPEVRLNGFTCKSTAIQRTVAVFLAVLLASSATFATISAAASTSPTATTASGDPFPVDGSDSFENGNLADWTAQGVKVQKKHVSGGSYAVRATADQSPAFLNRPLAKSQTDLIAQISVAVLDQDANWLSLLQLRTPDGDSIVIMVFSDKNRRLGFQLGDGGSIFTSDVAIGDGGWHVLRVRLKTGKAGAVEISLDGDSIPALSGPHSIASGPIGVIELGSVSSRHTFDALFDSVSLRKRRARRRPGFARQNRSRRPPRPRWPVSMTPFCNGRLKSPPRRTPPAYRRH